MKPNSLSKFSVWLISAALFPSAFCFSAFAQDPVYIYNSFGPGDTYDSGGGWVVAGTDGIPGGTGYLGTAEYFVPNISGCLDEIRLATFFMSGSAVSDFYIAQDNGSGIPGTILESFTDVLTPNGVLTINSVTRPLLQAGQEYWLCDEPAYPNTGTLWCLNSQGVANNFALESTEWSWYPASPDGATDAVFSISVVPVPESSTTIMVLLGAGLLVVLEWRRWKPAR
jgi:hypothetical protein